MTTFSIVIPVYKVEKYIRKCLESIEKQTFNDFEVLCVDDCGGDNSASIIEEFSARDNRFKLIRHEQNQGVAQARNTAIDNASGTYLVCVDPDDWLDEKALEKIYYAFEESNADSVWYNFCAYNEDKNTYSQNYDAAHPMLNHRGFINLTPEKLLLGSDYVWDKAYRLSKINEMGLRFPKGVVFEDCEFHFKCFTQITNIYYTDEILYNYRVRSESIVTNAGKGNVNIKDLFEVDRHIYDYLVETGKLENYKNTYLFLIGRHIKSVLLPNQKEKVINYTDELLNHIGFPQNFEAAAVNENT